MALKALPDVLKYYCLQNLWSRSHPNTLGQMNREILGPVWASIVLVLYKFNPQNSSVHGQTMSFLA